MIINTISVNEIELIVGTGIEGAGWTKPTRTEAADWAPAM